MVFNLIHVKDAIAIKNHIETGDAQLQERNYIEAITSFHAALRINPTLASSNERLQLALVIETQYVYFALVFRETCLIPSLLDR